MSAPIRWPCRASLIQPWSMYSLTFPPFTGLAWRESAPSTRRAWPGKTHSSIDCVRTGSTGRGLRRAYSCAQCAVGPHTSSAGGVGGQGGSTRPRVAPGRRRTGQSFRACRRAGRRGPLAFLKVKPPRKCTQHEADGVCGVVIFFTKSFWTDIALRISLSSVLLGLSLWASLFAFARPQYTSGRDRPNRLQARQSACTGSFVCLYTRIHSRATHAT